VPRARQGLSGTSRPEQGREQRDDHDREEGEHGTCHANHPRPGRSGTGCSNSASEYIHEGSSCIYGRSLIGTWTSCLDAAAPAPTPSASQLLAFAAGDDASAERAATGSGRVNGPVDAHRVGGPPPLC
jgi:hypothetical protein